MPCRAWTAAQYPSAVRAGLPTNPGLRRPTVRAARSGAARIRAARSETGRNRGGTRAHRGEAERSRAARSGDTAATQRRGPPRCGGETRAQRRGAERLGQRPAATEGGRGRNGTEQSGAVRDRPQQRGDTLERCFTKTKSVLLFRRMRSSKSETWRAGLLDCSIERHGCCRRPCQLASVSFGGVGAAQRLRASIDAAPLAAYPRFCPGRRPL